MTRQTVSPAASTRPLVSVRFPAIPPAAPTRPLRASALFSNTTGNNNTAIGSGALRNNTTGSGNIALGQAAGISFTTGNNNICIAQGGVPGESATIRIGGGNQERTFIGGILGNGPFGCDVSIDPVTGQLGVGACISSERFKKDIDSMDKAK